MKTMRRGCVFLVVLVVVGACQFPLTARHPSVALSLAVNYSAPSFPQGQAHAARLLLPAATQVSATLTDSTGRVFTSSQVLSGSSATLPFSGVATGLATVSAQASASGSSPALFANSTKVNITPQEATVTLNLLPVNLQPIASTALTGSLPTGATVSFRYAVQTVTDQVNLSISPSSLLVYLQNSAGAPVAVPMEP